MILSALFAIQALLFIGQIAIVFWVLKYVRDAQKVTISLSSKAVKNSQRSSKAWSP
ncbi:hypothetical protein LCGC14_0438070 [marine sediment metagenome]|uniref:Uncharacterized protein n=1 Tax=marine sediment metagenome TaxID=412755 RepID=A0A0F9T4E5_9ZZZZ